MADVVAIYVQNHFGFNGFRVPFVGNVILTNTFPIPFTDRWLEVGAIFFIVVAVIAIVGRSNGVNLTDGLDGLAGGTLVFAFISFLIIALLNEPLPAEPGPRQRHRGRARSSGFLWFNVHPAQVFMGDSGALSLGGMLAVIALITGQVLILPLIGIIFVLEVASDIIQVGSYKLRDKRVFRMAPLHHHFELGGWDEEKITMRFWISRCPGRHARGDAVRRLDTEVGRRSSARVVDLDRLTAAGVRDGGSSKGRSITVLGLARSGIALARFFADAGARVTVYDGRTAADLARRDRGAGRPADRTRAWTGRRAGHHLGRRGPHRDFAEHQPGLPHGRTPASRGAPGGRRGHRARPGGGAGPGQRDGSGAADVPLPDDRGNRHEGQDHDLIADRGRCWRPTPVTRSSWVATSGIPLVERLPELTPEHRVVIELSELQLPTLSHGTTVAVYTNVTADHLDRHGSLSRPTGRSSRRLAELVDPAGALVLNADDPVVAATLGPRPGAPS